MRKIKMRKAFIAVVLALAMLLPLNTGVFASGAATEYIVDFYYASAYKTTATLTYDAVGAELPDCGDDGWLFETYLVSDEDGTETLQEVYSYIASADNNVVTEELMDMLAGTVDVGSAGYTLRYKAYTNRTAIDEPTVSEKNMMSSRENMAENFFETVGYAATVSGGGSKYFEEGAEAPEETVYWFLNMTEELNAYYSDETGCIDIPYQAYMDIASAYFTNAPEMKTYLTNKGYLDAETELVHYYSGGMGSDWAWVLTDKDYYHDSDTDVYGYKLRGIFCSGPVEDLTGLTEYEDYYVYNGSAFEIDSAVELTLVEDATYGYRIAAYTEKAYYLAQTAKMGDCIYGFNAETGSFSDVYYCIYSNSGDYGIEFLYEDGTYTKIDNHLCYTADQEVVWKTAGNGSSAFDYGCREVSVTRTFDGRETTSTASSSGVISGGGEVWLWSIPCAEFKIEAPHCSVEVIRGLTDRGDGTYSYYEGSEVELKITPDAGYEVTEVASYLFDVYVVIGDYVSSSGTWLLCPEFIPSTILVTTAETSLPSEDDGIIIGSSEDSAAAVTVQIPKEDAGKVSGLILVAEEPEATAEEQAASLVVKQLSAEDDGVFILDIHFENAEGEETKVNAEMVVTVPVPDGWDPAKVGVYYVNPDTGEVVDMNASVSGDGKAVTFTTNHFSYYALVQTNNETHTHSYGTEWKYDGKSHWHECSCGDKTGEAAHTFEWVIDREATASEKGSKHQECSVCGYKGEAVEIPAAGSTGNPDSPQTGYNGGRTALWFALSAVSAAGLGAALLCLRKRRTGR